MIHRLSSLPNVLILIKVHNFLFSRYKEENWEQKFYDFCQNHPNVKYIKEPDTQSIFPLGDMMITDTGTTAAFEFSLTYKPVFIYCSQSWFDKFNDVDVEVEKKLTEMALCFENIDQIYVFAQKLQNKDPQILANLELQKEQQKKLIDQYLFNPGSATAEAIKIIMKELKLNDRKP
jgi:CDP-glycerol glycerophosphotransferase (TagB/SpsB family)